MSPVTLRNAAIGVTLALSLPSCSSSDSSALKLEENNFTQLTAHTLLSAASHTAKALSNRTESLMPVEEESRGLRVDMMPDPFTVEDGEKLRQLVSRMPESEHVQLASMILSSHRRVLPVLEGIHAVTSPGLPAKAVEKLILPDDFVSQFKSQSNPHEDGGPKNKNCGPAVLASILRSSDRASLDSRNANRQIENARLAMFHLAVDGNMRLRSRDEKSTTPIEHFLMGARVFSLRAESHKDRKVSCVKRALAERKHVIVMVNARAFGGDDEDHYVRVKEIRNKKGHDDKNVVLYDPWLERPLNVTTEDLEKGMAAGRGLAVYVFKADGAAAFKNYTGPTLDNLHLFLK